jgi:hypothetical protein
MRTRVVPESKIPAVVVRILVEVPYRMDPSIPQYWLDGEVDVMGLSITRKR